MRTGFHIIEKDICEKVSDELDKIGLLYRLFSRTKDNKSISEKLERKKIEGEPYRVDGKKIQDIIGVRVVTYFQDDVLLVKEILSKSFEFIAEEIDVPELTVFKPKRTNIICGFHKRQKDIFDETIISSTDDNSQLIDSTFELQLRTILSEGWHEIDHSLRYKCKLDWEGHNEKERMLNGIYANLETNDIALKGLFNELAYQHFKNRNWEALIRTKFRLKFQPTPLKKELAEILERDNSIAKFILKVDRESVLKKIVMSDFLLPISITNLLYLINYFEKVSTEITDITPDIIKDY